MIFTIYLKNEIKVRWIIKGKNKPFTRYFPIGMKPKTHNNPLTIPCISKACQIFPWQLVHGGLNPHNCMWLLLIWSPRSTLPTEHYTNHPSAHSAGLSWAMLSSRALGQILHPFPPLYISPSRSFYAPQPSVVLVLLRHIPCTQTGSHWFQWASKQAHVLSPLLKGVTYSVQTEAASFGRLLTPDRISLASVPRPAEWATIFKTNSLMLSFSLAPNFCPLIHGKEYLGHQAIISVAPRWIAPYLYVRCLPGLRLCLAELGQTGRIILAETSHRDHQDQATKT